MSNKKNKQPIKIYCFICNQCCHQESNNGANISDILKKSNIRYYEILKLIISETCNLTILNTDMICQTCIVLLEQIYNFQQKTKMYEQLVIRQVYRNYNIDEQLFALDIDQKAMKYFTLEENGDFSCNYCLYKTSFSDTIAPHYNYHKYQKDYFKRLQTNKQNVEPTICESYEVPSGLDYFVSDIDLQFLNDSVDISDENETNDNCDLVDSRNAIENTSIEYEDKNMILVDTRKCEENQLIEEPFTNEFYSRIIDNKEAYYLCNKCSFVSSTESEMKSHHVKHKVLVKILKKVRLKPCVNCNKMKRPIEVCSHGEATEKGLMVVSCQKCEEKFLNEDLLKEHMYLTHFVCKVCGKVKQSLHKIKEHLHSLHRPTFTCDICFKQYRGANKLKDHKLVHEGKFKYYCEFCNKGCNTLIGLKEHVSFTHTKIPSYICEKCGQEFYQDASYRLHCLLHNDPRPFKCKDCSSTFTTRSYLSVHRRRAHTGQFTHECEYCHKKFVAKTYYKTHLIKHTNIYPYNCESCKKGFVKRRDYGNHMRKLHDDHSVTFSNRLLYKIAIRPDYEKKKKIDVKLKKNL